MFLGLVRTELEKKKVDLQQVSHALPLPESMLEVVEASPVFFLLYYFFHLLLFYSVGEHACGRGDFDGINSLLYNCFLLKNNAKKDLLMLKETYYC
jgi:hypothetical protein